MNRPDFVWGGLLEGRGWGTERPCGRGLAGVREPPEGVSVSPRPAWGVSWEGRGVPVGGQRRAQTRGGGGLAPPSNMAISLGRGPALITRVLGPGEELDLYLLWELSLQKGARAHRAEPRLGYLGGHLTGQHKGTVIKQCLEK